MLTSIFDYFEQVREFGMRSLFRVWTLLELNVKSQGYSTGLNRTSFHRTDANFHEVGAEIYEVIGRASSLYPPSNVSVLSYFNATHSFHKYITKARPH